MFPESGAAQRPVCSLRLDGCQVSPGAASGSPQNLRIRIAQRGQELALLQVGDSWDTVTPVSLPEGRTLPQGYPLSPDWGVLPEPRPCSRVTT